MSTPTHILSGHKKKVDSIQFHPTAANILASGSSDKTVKIWDIETGKELFSVDNHHGDGITSISWNYNGSLLATVAKDKKIRVIDPRKNTVVSVTSLLRLTILFRPEMAIKE
jgi:WD40 repeat protein